jgi:hypothetical protein
MKPFSDQPLADQQSGLQDIGLSIFINGIDRTDKISINGFRLKNRLTNQIDTLDFQVIGNDFKPSVLDEVEVFRGIIPGETKLWGGHITEIEQIVRGLVVIYRVSVHDYSFKMDAKLVARTYTLTTVDAILEDIRDNFLPEGYTVNSDADIPVRNLRFNYIQPSKCFQELADLYGYDWFVDENRVIQFFRKEDNPAPFNLNDTSGNYKFGSLVFNENIEQLRNSVFVRGGLFLTDQITLENLDTQIDGESKILQLGYRYANFILKFNGVEKTVGVDFLNDPSEFDALYNFQEKVLKFETAPLETDKPVTFEGNVYIPVRTLNTDPLSIDRFGEFQHVIIDKQIRDKNTAFEYGLADIDTYARSVKAGSFTTDRDGLRVGQRIVIQSDIRDLEDTFVITSITATPSTPNEFVYDVDFVTTKSMDFIDLMQRILLERNRNIDIDENDVEVLTILRTFEDIVTHDYEARVNPWGLNEIPQWVAGDYYPVDDDDQKRTPRVNSGAKAF